MLYPESDLDPEEHDTDTQGEMALHFCAFPMVGKRFCPRSRGRHRQSIDRLDPDQDDGPLTSLPPHGDRIGPFFASLAAGQPPASGALKRLVAGGPRHHFDQAVCEVGRLFNIIFILDYLHDSRLRRRVRRGLLKGEPLHALARCVHDGNRGRIDGRDGQQQMSRGSALGLILASIIDGQIRQMDEGLRVWDPPSEGIAPRLLASMSPIGWDPMGLEGESWLDRNVVEPRSDALRALFGENEGEFKLDLAES